MKISTIFRNFLNDLLAEAEAETNIHPSESFDHSNKINQEKISNRKEFNFWDILIEQMKQSHQQPLPLTKEVELFLNEPSNVGIDENIFNW